MRPRGERDDAEVQPARGTNANHANIVALSLRERDAHSSRGARGLHYFFFAGTGSRITNTGVSIGGIRSVFASNARSSLSLGLLNGTSSRAVSKFEMQMTSPSLAP